MYTLEIETKNKIFKVNNPKKAREKILYFLTLYKLWMETVNGKLYVMYQPNLLGK